VRPSRHRLDLRGVVILIVEDHDDSREMLRQMVGAFGAATLMAAGGRAALRLIGDVRPDLVFLDLVMPGMDGFEFIDRLREGKEFARIPVIAVTALAGRADVMRTWEAGFNGHLIKPVTFDVVEAQLERVFWAHAQTHAS
jgi:CheY-like chemotaxis protein